MYPPPDPPVVGEGPGPSEGLPGAVVDVPPVVPIEPPEEAVEPGVGRPGTTAVVSPSKQVGSSNIILHLA